MGVGIPRQTTKTTRAARQYRMCMYRNIVPGTCAGSSTRQYQPSYCNTGHIHSNTRSACARLTRLVPQDDVTGTKDERDNKSLIHNSHPLPFAQHHHEPPLPTTQSIKLRRSPRSTRSTTTMSRILRSFLPCAIYSIAGIIVVLIVSITGHCIKNNVVYSSRAFHCFRQSRTTSNMVQC